LLEKLFSLAFSLIGPDGGENFFPSAANSVMSGEREEARESEAIIPSKETSLLKFSVIPATIS